jgi:hypothetical protein
VLCIEIANTWEIMQGYVVWQEGGWMGREVGRVDRGFEISVCEIIRGKLMSQVHWIRLDDENIAL